MTVQEQKRRPGDIIEHTKKCRAFDFHGSIDSKEVDRWLKATEKAFNILELTEAQKASNVYGLLIPLMLGLHELGYCRGIS